MYISAYPVRNAYAGKGCTQIDTPGGNLPSWHGWLTPQNRYFGYRYGYIFDLRNFYIIDTQQLIGICQSRPHQCFQQLTAIYVKPYLTFGAVLVPWRRGVNPLAASSTLKTTSGNLKLCGTLHRRNAHLPFVNSAFVSVSSLDFRVSGGALTLPGSLIQASTVHISFV